MKAGTISEWMSWAGFVLRSCRLLLAPVLLIGVLFAGFSESSASVVIVDGPRGAGYAENGRWYNSGANDEYNGQSRYSNREGATATWTPNIPTTGRYKVYHWSTNKNYNRDEEAPFTIYHANGSSTFIVNQKNEHGSFIQLGSTSFCFQAGSSGKVVLTRHNGGNHGTSTSADAIKFELEAAGACGTFQITASAGGGGSILPSGTTTVSVGADQTYVIAPDAGYAVEDVTVDGVSEGAVSTYTFTNVEADHEIIASFIAWHTIVASAGIGGTITPAGNVAVEPGTDQGFTISPNAGFVIADVKADGVSLGAVASHTFSNVTADHTIEAIFRPATHTITATTTGNGVISPAGAISVVDMGSQTFSMTADPGYTVLDVLVDGVSLGAISSYTFSDVIEEHDITVSFTAVYEITATAAANGTISPSGSVPVQSGHDQSFDISTDSGYLIAELLVDGVAQADAESQSHFTYDFIAVHSDHTIEVRFDRGYVITPTATAGGTINPADQQEVAPGADSTFTINPDTCFDRIDVEVDGGSIGVVSAYTFTSVDADHTIHASFAARPPLAITTVAGRHSAISPSGSTVAICGSQQQFTINYDPKLKDLHLLVNNDSHQIVDDGVYQGGVCVATGTPNECIYTIASVEEDYVIRLSEVFHMADYPLDIQTHPAPPNIMFVLDDSGSMDWEFMTPESGGKFNYEYYVFDNPGDNAYWGNVLSDEQRRMWKSQWAGYNKMYYNPSVTYSHWPTLPDAAVPPNATLSHPKLTDSLQLQNQYLTFDGVTIPRAHYYTYSAEESKAYLVVIDYPSTSIKYYEVSATTNGTGSTQKIDGLTLTASPPDDVITSRTYSEEMQNFANWFTYYRRRELAATMAVATVIDQISNTYVGIRTINSSATYGIQQPLTAVRVLYLDVDNNLVFEDDSNSLLDTLYGLHISSYGTPLRTGLEKVGQYFDRTDTGNTGNLSGNPWFPWQLGGECQQSFVVVMTDGYWNGGNPSRGDADHGKGAPYQDDYPNYTSTYANTLADVAMYYHEKDLVDDYSGMTPRGSDEKLDDRVPGSATYQHLVTYGVSFGVKGSLEQAAAIESYTTIPGCTVGCNYPDWPNPAHGDAEKIDDLWHASVNGRGIYVNASDPMSLVQALVDVINNIAERDGSSSSVSVNGDELFMSVGTTTRMYQTRYESPDWVGDIRAYGINADGTVETTNPVWQAADVLDSDLGMGADISSRLIATLKNDASPDGVAFQTITDLTTEQQASFGSALSTVQRQEIMDYVRGSNAKESVTDFRIREKRLGDIVNSTAVYMDGYLYVGSNDGMLHAFDAITGHELFAYVPNLVMPNLKYLKEQDYGSNHLFFVDNSPYAKKMGDKTFLVGGLGKGGKGYYSLDITNPSEGGDPETFKFDNLTSAELVDMVKWEYPQQNTPVTDGLDDLGYSYSRAFIVKSNADAASAGSDYDGITGTDDDGLSYPAGINSSDDDLRGYVVAFGNGYGSFNGNAVLYFLNPETGTLIKKIDVGGGPGNGLSTPVAVDVDSDYKVDYYYAGDLMGNLWKFDVTSHDPDQWQVAYCDDGNDADSCIDSLSPKPLFTTRSNQSITMKPDVMKHLDKDSYMVIFGTGRFLDELDWLDQTDQALYGIWDFGDDDDDSEYLGSINSDNSLTNMPEGVSLLEQTVVYEQVATANEQGDAISTYIRVLTQHEADWTTVPDTNSLPAAAWEDPTVHAGWTFTLPLAGERSTANAMIRDGKAILVSFVLDDDRCSAGAESLIHEMNPMTGGRLTYAVFDINEDMAVGEGDYIYLDLDDDGNADDIDGDGTPDPVPATATKRPGRLQPPAILRKDDGTEIKYFSSSNASIQMVVEKAEQRGIFYWREN